MDNDRGTRLDHRPDTIEHAMRARLDPVERERRIAEARDFARRTKNDPREAAMLDEIEALQADSPIP